ncbi:hypothetical protein AX17_002254 [Amanita inopinata Kibby_2008]|nr:hypothetical protein AX17_002254 [Amanita inopinata Kibby_2008]
MVKITSALFVLASFVVAGFASAIIEQGDIGKVKTDLDKIAHYITSLDNAVSAISDSVTIPQILAIQSAVRDLEKSLDQGTKDVQDVHKISKPDANQILSKVKRFEPAALHLLSNIATEKNAFTHLPIGNVAVLIKQNLLSLFSRTSEFESALIALAPVDIKEQAKTMKRTIDTAFQKAIAAYS